MIKNSALQGLSGCFSLDPTLHVFQDSENSEKILEIKDLSPVPRSTIHLFCGLNTKIISQSFVFSIHYSDNKM